MKKFTRPMMVVQKLMEERIITESKCWESFDCEKCYGDVVICDGAFECTGLVCSCLGTLHI